MTRTSDHKNQHKKIWLEHESRCRTDYNHAFYFEGFMMQQQSDAKNDFYNTFYL